jgi:hypothetical protein
MHVIQCDVWEKSLLSWRYQCFSGVMPCLEVKWPSRSWTKRLSISENPKLDTHSDWWTSHFWWSSHGFRKNMSMFFSHCLLQIRDTRTNTISITFYYINTHSMIIIIYMKTIWFHEPISTICIEQTRYDRHVSWWTQALGIPPSSSVASTVWRPSASWRVTWRYDPARICRYQRHMPV